MRSLQGKIIEKHIRRLPLLHPAIKLLQYCIMPDHVHLLLFVTSPLDMHLGNYIGRLKILIFQECRAVTGSGISILEDDFYDCILHSGRSLDTIYRYIRSNPHRLAVRKLHPEFFQRVNTLPIGNKTYAAYGNFQLLDNPFKEQVVIHRADTEAKRQADRELWLYTAANGGVLVSPFISPAEKAIRAQAESTGGRFILITDTPMPPRYKPSSRDFALCEQGRLLIITLSSPLLPPLPPDLPRHERPRLPHRLPQAIAPSHPPILPLFSPILPLFFPPIPLPLSPLLSSCQRLAVEYLR